MRTKNKKQWMLRVAICTLAWMLILPTGALGGQPAAVPVHDVLYNGAQQLQGIAVVEGTLYMLSQQHLYRWRPGESSAVEMMSAQPFDIDWEYLHTPVLLSDGQALWRFERTTGRLQQLMVQGDAYTAAAPVQLDWRMFVGDGIWPDRMWLINGMLWMINEGDNGMLLTRCALKAGAQPQRMKVRDVFALATGRDGQLLALQQDMQLKNKRLEQGKEEPPILLGRLDANGDAFSPLMEMDLGQNPGLYSTALLDTGKAVFVAAGDTVWRVADGVQQACALLPNINFLYTGSAALWPAGADSLYVAGERHVLIRSQHPEALAQAAQLRISQDVSTGRRHGEQVSIALGDTALVVSRDMADSTQEELATAFLLGQVHNDILVLQDYAFDLPNLGRKGYLLDLSVSPALRAYAQGLDAKVQPLLWQNGKLVMIPYRVGLGVCTAHASALEALGLSVPRDFFALCDLVERYEEDDLQGQSGLDLLPAEHSRETLIHLGVDLFFHMAHAKGDSISFDDPLFRSMMQRAAQVGTLHNNSEGEYPILNLYATLDDFNWLRQEGEYPKAFDFVALSAAPGMAPAVPASFTMLAINSRTQMPQQAIRCLEEMVKTIDPRTHALLMPGTTGPLPNPHYAHDQAEEEQRLKLYEQTAAHASNESTRAIYRKEAEAVRQRLQNRERDLKYLETADSVEKARAIADHLLPQTGLMHSQQLALGGVVKQYAQGAIDLEQFIRQANNKLHLVTQERQ